MLHTKFQDHRTSGSGEDFSRFLQYMDVVAIRPFKLSFPFPMEAPHEIWLEFAKRFQSRFLKMVEDGLTDARAWGCYK